MSILYLLPFAWSAVGSSGGGATLPGGGQAA